MPSNTGMASSRTYAISLSMACGSTCIVVDRAYMSHRLGHAQVVQDQVELGHVGDPHAERLAELLPHARRPFHGPLHVLAAVVGRGHRAGAGSAVDQEADAAEAG